MFVCLLHCLLGAQQQLFCSTQISDANNWILGASLADNNEAIKNALKGCMPDIKDLKRQVDATLR